MSGGGWTLAARFSNADSKNWMRDDAYWWYDIQSSQGSPTSPSSNYDMISEAFGKSKEMTLRSLEATIAHTPPFYVLTLIA